MVHRRKLDKPGYITIIWKLWENRTAMDQWSLMKYAVNLTYLYRAYVAYFNFQIISVDMYENRIGFSRDPLLMVDEFGLRTVWSPASWWFFCDNARLLLSNREQLMHDGATVDESCAKMDYWEESFFLWWRCHIFDGVGVEEYAWGRSE